MFVYSLSKKSAIRMGLLILAVFAGIIIGIAAILTAIDVGARSPKLPIYSVERSDNKIALTFDCAWGNSNTDELLSILEKENIRATFFVTGEFCDKFPDDIRKIHAAGHEIENHSNAHPHVKGMNINDLIADTKEAGQKIEMLTGKAPTLYRSPYGEYDDIVISTIEGMGYKMIQWSVDSIDWQEPNAETIKKRILEKTVQGSILLFHNDLANTTEALPSLLSELKQTGFEFSPVSEMIYYKDYYLDNTGKQIFRVNAMSFEVPEGNPEMAEVAAIIEANFTPREIKEMSNGISFKTAQKLSRLLSKEQINLLSKAAENIDSYLPAMAAPAFDDDYQIAEEAEEEEYEIEEEDYEDFVDFENIDPLIFDEDLDSIFDGEELLEKFQKGGASPADIEKIKELQKGEASTADIKKVEEVQKGGASTADIKKIEELQK